MPSPLAQRLSQTFIHSAAVVPADFGEGLGGADVALLFFGEGKFHALPVLQRVTAEVHRAARGIRLITLPAWAAGNQSKELQSRNKGDAGKGQVVVAVDIKHNAGK